MVTIKQMVSFRLDPELVKRLDLEAARRSEAAGIPGAVKRADLVNLLLENGLAAMEKVELGKPGKPKATRS